MIRYTGWKPDPPAGPEELVLGTDYIRTLLAQTPSSSSMLPQEPWRLVQYEESCSGQTMASMMYELTGEKGSPFASWYWARHRDIGSDDVQDTGVSVKSILWALRTFGVPPWERWNRASLGFGINKKPPAAGMLKTKHIDAVPLYGIGSELVHAASVAADLGLPVAYVVHANGQFSDSEAGVVGPKEDPLPANHIVYSRGQRINEAGRREFYTPNFWIGWGDGNGAAWVDESWLGGSELVLVGRSAS